jgi:hypothetical protein
VHAEVGLVGVGPPLRAVGAEVVKNVITSPGVRVVWTVNSVVGISVS